VDIIQYNAMHKFVGVLDNPRTGTVAGAGIGTAAGVVGANPGYTGTALCHH